MGPGPSLKIPVAFEMLLLLGVNVQQRGEVFGPGNTCPWEMGPTSLELGLLYVAADGRCPQTLPSGRSDPASLALDSGAAVITSTGTKYHRAAKAANCPGATGIF